MCCMWPGPLPAGRLEPAELWFGIALAGLAAWELWWSTNPLTSTLALSSGDPAQKEVAALHFGGRPSRRHAAPHRLVRPRGPGCSMPFSSYGVSHLLAIAWMYRNHYARAGLQLLPRNDADRLRLRFWGILGLDFCQLNAASLGRRKVDLVGALVLGVGFFLAGIRLALHRSNSLARRLAHCLNRVLAGCFRFAHGGQDRIRHQGIG